MGSSKVVGATCHGQLSPLLLGAGEHVALGHYAGVLAAGRRDAPFCCSKKLGRIEFELLTLKYV
jgi:hypothetical protein